MKNFLLLKRLTFLITLCTAVIFPQLAFGLEQEAVVKKCLGDDILNYAPFIADEAKPRLEEVMTGKSMHLADRNKLVIKGVRSVSFDGWNKDACRTLRVIYNVTLERTLRRDASGTVQVYYGLKRGSAKPGVTFEIRDPDMGFYDLSHLTLQGELWWKERTPDSFFEPVLDWTSSGHIVFLIPFKH